MSSASKERKEDAAHEFYDTAVENMEYVIDRGRAREIMTKLGDKVVALDFETTSLTPDTGYVRLSCIYHPDVGAVVIDHMFAGPFKEWCPDMLGPMWAVYNAKFELTWFDAYAYGKVDLIDVDFLRKANKGGNALFPS